MSRASRASRASRIALVGATATGKTPLGEALAETLGAEVVCADSRQVFRELEVGTGKPAPEQRRALPHHLFEALCIGERASAGWYASACAAACETIRGRGRLPLLVGGSGLYLKAAQCGLAPEPPHDPAARARLRTELDRLGPEALHARLARTDPRSAVEIGPRDRQRIVRALEVYETSRRPMSWWRERQTALPPPEAWTVIELVVAPDALRSRIAARTRDLFEHGLVEETRALLAAGRREDLRALRAIGYDEAVSLIEGRSTRAEAVAQTDRRTAQLAKRQRTWFRHQVEALRLNAEPFDIAALLTRIRSSGAVGG